MLRKKNPSTTKSLLLCMDIDLGAIDSSICTTVLRTIVEHNAVFLMKFHVPLFLSCFRRRKGLLLQPTKERRLFEKMVSHFYLVRVEIRKQGQGRSGREARQTDRVG